MLFFVQSKIILSIISHVYKSCFITGTTALQQSATELKCAATITLFFGGSLSNLSVIFVVKVRVPSLPAKSLHMLKSFPLELNGFNLINSSIAYPLFLLCILDFGNSFLILFLTSTENNSAFRAL